MSVLRGVGIAVVESRDVPFLAFMLCSALFFVLAAKLFYICSGALALSECQSYIFSSKKWCGIALFLDDFVINGTEC